MVQNVLVFIDAKRKEPLPISGNLYAFRDTGLLMLCDRGAGGPVIQNQRGVCDERMWSCIHAYGDNTLHMNEAATSFTMFA